VEKYIEILKNVSLFEGIEEDNIPSLLKCLSSKNESYKAGSVIFNEGDTVEYVGVVLSGSVQIITNDYYGNRNILSSVSDGGLFGEAFACAGTVKYPVSAVAISDSNIMLINYRKIITTCSNTCIFHTKLIFNMLKVVAEKNILLSRKLEFTSKRSIREKLMAFLLHEAKRKNNNSFEIHFNRQELADYLSVDRCAMSKELCKMRDEGILEFNKNSFNLLGENYFF